MKTLLRSCFAADPTDKLDLLAANFELLEKSPVPRHWANPEDTAIYVAIRSFVQTHGHVPGVQALRAQFSAAREVDAVDRLERLALAKPLVRGNFATHLELLVRDRRAAALAEIAKQEIHILHQRCEVEEPDERGQPRKLRLHGEGDARAWGERARARLEADWPSRTERELNWVRGDQLVEREQEWLWYGYLAEGKVTLVEGPGSIGKSTVVSDLVARLTSGAPMPGEAAGLPPRDVVWITTEEDPATDTLPRLRLAGADLSRLHFRAIDQHWDARKLAELLELCDQLENPVVVIDALKDTLPGVKDYEEISVRAHMLPLVRACHEKNITMLPIRHWKKGAAPASERGAGSVAWRNVVYGTISAGRLGDETFVAPEKLRGGLKGPAWQYVIDPVQEAHRRRPTPCLRWVRAREDIDADDLAMAQPESREERSRLQEAKDLLEVALAKGPRKGTAVETEALAADISRASLRRAREALCRVEQRADGWWWELRDPPAPRAASDVVPDLDLDDDEAPAPVVAAGTPPTTAVTTAADGEVVEASGVWPRITAALDARDAATVALQARAIRRDTCGSRQHDLRCFLELVGAAFFTTPAGVEIYGDAAPEHRAMLEALLREEPALVREVAVPVLVDVLASPMPH